MAQAEQTSPRKGRRTALTWKRFFVGVLLLGCIVLGGLAGLVAASLRDMPPLDPEKLLTPPTSSTILDVKNQPVAKLHDEDSRSIVPNADIPKYLKDALVASEDKNFYNHFGVDPMGVARAVFTLGRAGGGSTITQQLTRNVYLTLDRTPKRKLQEMYLAVKLERIYTKDEILGFYLNTIFWGHWANGVQSASQMYFGKDAKDLTLAESAMLVGIIPQPNYYSPYENFDRATKMEDIVLDLMVSQGKVTAQQSAQAKAEKIKLVGLKENRTFNAPYFVDYTMSQAQELLKGRYGSSEAALNAIYADGLKIYTTLDPDIQKASEKAVTDLMANFTAKDKSGAFKRQAAAVVIDPVTGYIAAMVGGRDYDPNVSQAWNRATQSVRQPGSSIKPLVDYAPAIYKRVITAGTVFDDVPTVFPGGWKPTDFDDKYYGLIGIREAVFRSQNIPAIKTLQTLGVDNGIDFLKKLGISTIVTSGSENDRNLSTAIGGITKGISPLELTQAYTALANHGIRIDATAIREIRDRYDKVIYAAQPAKTVVMDDQTAYVMTDILKSVVNDSRGTGYRARIDHPAAGKSGTTDNWADAWFVGYTTDYVASVWIGEDQPTPMYDLYGQSLPARIWQQIMTTAERSKPVRDFSRPANIVETEICTVSGKRPSPICPKDKIIKEVFIQGTEPKPTDICDVHVQARVDKATGLLATPLEPAALTETRVFIKRPQPLIYPLPYGNPPVDAKDELPTKFADGTAANGSIPFQPPGTPTTNPQPGTKPTSTTPGGTATTPTTPPGNNPSEPPASTGGTKPSQPVGH